MCTDLQRLANHFNHPRMIRSTSCTSSPRSWACGPTRAATTASEASYGRHVLDRAAQPITPDQVLERSSRPRTRTRSGCHCAPASSSEWPCASCWSHRAAEPATRSSDRPRMPRRPSGPGPNSHHHITPPIAYCPSCETTGILHPACHPCGSLSQGTPRAPEGVLTRPSRAEMAAKIGLVDCFAVDRAKSEQSRNGR